MDFLSSSVDIAFFLLTLLIIYNQPILPTSSSTTEQQNEIHPPNQESNLPDSPLPSPGYLSVPSITITPSSLGNLPIKPPLPGAGGVKGKHKKKSVSFSLSSMDDLKQNENTLSNSNVIKRFRPPTPFFKSSSSNHQSILLNLEMSPINNENSLSSPINNNAVIQKREKELGVNEELEKGQLDHGILQEDSMGIQKKWLVTGAQ
ncbi:uncharacterized protein I206_107519 [Kwoniella pini CBS 10737]|uniref:Uncharacterized protein n=1 Tax=Kwoniella pini CBS 10737 TaxID=1296096 RepID=A0A1B9HXJ9_9TREE|nr:uncharacterized protein I206_05847 [Kwoniella pini CBS 10737]OCF47981.1 hypothetical protein I206_05847 [Kwoniella pini CBS 10737]